MRPVLRRYGSGTFLCLLGAALLLAGTGASLGFLALTEEKDRPAPDAREQATNTGPELNAVVGLDAPLVPIDPLYVHADPPVAASALPDVHVDRDLAVEKAGLGVDANVALASGSRTTREDGSAHSVSTTSMRAILTPTLAPAVVAAATFTLAGLAAYFWGGLQAWGAKHLVLPLIGLYAKISRAEVFDNGVRERIFQAIRANPGVSASDLARFAEVSWGTTIYHLDVLEQTRMVTSLRKGRYRRYFENGAPLTTSKDAVAILRNPVTASVVEALRTRPGVTQKELAGATGMSPQALHWHVARLVETGLVRKERDGRLVRHFTA